MSYMETLIHDGQAKLEAAQTKLTAAEANVLCRATYRHIPIDLNEAGLLRSARNKLRVIEKGGGQ